MLVTILDTVFCLAWQFSRPSCMPSCGITFADAYCPNMFVPRRIINQVHDVSAALLVVMDTKRFASPLSFAVD